MLIYCNVVWGSCCKTYLCNLNIIQKKLVRVMSFRKRFEHTTPLFSNYNMLTIENINKYISQFLYTVWAKELPHQITATQDFNSFKFSVKKYLLTKQSPWTNFTCILTVENFYCFKMSKCFFFEVVRTAIDSFMFYMYISFFLQSCVLFSSVEFYNNYTFNFFRLFCTL